MSFLPTVECGKFKLKKAFQRGKILACTKNLKSAPLLPEMESSRTHFEVLEGQVLENFPVLGSRTALFLEPLKFC